MTKKDYIVIARMLLEATRDSEESRRTIYDMANRFAVEAVLDNPRFSRDRFFAACGIQKGQ